MIDLLVIGNGPSADTPAVAAAERHAQRVMRINNWPAGDHIGTRCDIWGTSFNIDIAQREAPEIWWSGWPWRPALGKPFVPRPQWQCPTQEELTTLYNWCAPKDPSTGIVLLSMAISRGYHATIAGFDHFRGGPHHYWEDVAPGSARDPNRWHQPDAEQRLVESWIHAGLLTRLS